jgi:hypothetical protein
MIDRGNHLSMNTHLRLGFRPIHTVFVFKLFDKSFFIYRNAQNNKFSFSSRTSFGDALERTEQKESWPSKSATC